MANYTTTITNEGAALLASVIANQGTLTFNEFRFSENDYTGQESTLTEGTFLGVFITASAAASVIDSTTIKTSAQFNNSTITGNHNLYSIGIVGTDGNTTALIAVCTTTDPDVIREPLTGTSTYAFNVNLSVSDTSQITVTGTTAAVLYDVDVVDTLISTATDKPLSANMGRVLNEKVESLTNPNLLDNPWFTVNQRGASSYSTPGDYTADRWYMPFGGLTVGISSSGATLTATSDTVLDQKFETDELKGKTVTLSIKHFDGTIEQGTVQFPSTTGTNPVVITGGELQACVDTYGNCYFRIYIATGNTITARAIKLEIGSVSTLHLDVAPDYTTELLKCQRFFVRITARASYAVMASGLMDNATYFWGAIPLSVPLRANPTVTKGGVFNLRQNGSLNSVTDVTVDYRAYGELSVFVTPDTSLTANAPAMFVFNSASTYIDLSADL